jgi:16S rRNA (cytidine1402-2'-O)-methyltransferase
MTKRPSSQTQSSKHGAAEPMPDRGKPQKPLAPGLYIVATPIGNAGDIGLRALKVLAAADLVAAEDTRVTARLFAIHGLSKPLMPYNDHNAAGMRPRLLERLRRGDCVALVSDAGTPLVSDPGYRLVREALAENLAVHAIPGASAPLAALTLAGLPTDRFLFAGFLPGKAGERRSVLEELRGVSTTLVFFESPNRLSESLAALAEVLGPRPAAVARELTKLHEEVRRGDLPELASAYAREALPKGEITLVIGPPPRAEADWRKADGLLDRALGFMPLKAAADLVAEALDLPRRAVYARALDRKNRDGEA